MNIGQPKHTQVRVINLFVEELGYQYLGDWHERPNNSAMEEQLLAGKIRLV